jgi:hypothetical protein
MHYACIVTVAIEKVFTELVESRIGQAIVFQYNPFFHL